MIVPINGLRYYQFDVIHIDDEILLKKEKDNPHDVMAIAAFNLQGQKIGYVGKRIGGYNKKLYQRMADDWAFGKVWNISKWQILVELENLIPPPNK